MLRTAMVNDQFLAGIREFLARAVLARVAAALGIPEIRMEAAFAQMFGLVAARYILEIEPLASAGLDELVDLVAPTIQRYLVPDGLAPGG
jgi:hypothetical protein